MDNLQTKKFGEIATILKGKNPVLSNTMKSGFQPYLSAKFLRGIADAEFASNDDKNSVLVTKDEIIIICDGSNSGESFHGFEGVLSSTMGKIQYKKEVNSRYVLYFLHSAITHLRRKKTGTAIPHLDIKGLMKMDLYFPSPAEQKRIADKLDIVFGKIAIAKEATEKNLLNVQELFETCQQSIFDTKRRVWVEKKLGDVATFRNGMNFTKVSRGENIKIVGVGDFQKNFWVPFESLETVTIDGALSEIDMLKENDIVVVRSNGNPALIGRTLLAGKVKGSVSHSGFTIRVRLNSNDISPQYLCHYLKSQKARKELIASGTGTNIKSLNQQALASLSVVLPPISEQKVIVKNLEDLSLETKALEKIYEQKLADLEELKSSVLSLAFSGKLTVENHRPAVQSAVPSPYIRNQVHAAIIEQVAKDGGWSTEVAVAKYDHLLQEVYGLALGYQFADATFGPFDAQIKKLVASGLGRNRWFTKRHGMVVFGDNASALLKYQSNLYRSAKNAMNELSQLGITALDADRVELLSTICHSIKKTGSNTLESVRSYMAQWPTDNNRTKAEKFTEEQTSKCLKFINDNGLQRRLLQTV